MSKSKAGVGGKAKATRSTHATTNHHQPSHALSMRGFDFSEAMARLIADMTQRLPDLRHIDVSAVAVAIAQTRRAVSHGLYASLTPLRFEQGARQRDIKGQVYAMERILDSEGREMRYIVTFYLPRFMEVDLAEKLITIVHELWHISPNFDGDLRRFSGRCYAHSHSQAQYDAHMELLVKRWLALNPPEHLYSFLRLNFAELQSTFGGVRGLKIRRPRLLPLRESG